MTNAPARLVTVDEYMRLAERHYRVEVVGGDLRIEDNQIKS